MDEPEFKFTLKNVLIFLTALGAGALASAVFHSPFTGFIIIAGACWYLVAKKS